MPRLTSFSHVFCSRSMITCHARLCLTVYVVQGRYGIPCSTSSEHVCYPKDMRECEARRCLTVCAVQGRRWHVTPDEVRLYVLSKSDDNMPHATCVLPKDHAGMPRTMSFDRLFFPWAMMACHA
uniref:Uncharacterized protein n=1 Tax=Solanum lycopersicum TaxID=4081 RepID=A0A3Q7FK36_SOLLC